MTCYCHAFFYGFFLFQVCLWCTDKSHGGKYLDQDKPLIVKYLDPNFELHIQYLPTGLCKGCRTRLTSQSNKDPKKRRSLNAFALPDYNAWVENTRNAQSVRSRSGDGAPCDCFTCQIARCKHFVARIVPELPCRRYPSGIPGTPIPSPLSSASSLEPPPPPPSASASAINYSASAMPTTSSSYASPAQTAYRSSQQDSKR